MKIRLATKEDAHTIWELTRQLAEYEQALASFTVKENFFAHAFFEKKPGIECYLIEAQEEVVGMGQIFTTLSTYTGREAVNLQDFIIKEAHRNKGYGKEFIKFIVRLAHERGYCRLNWSVVGWNRSAITFYEKMGASTLKNIDFIMTETCIGEICHDA